MSSKSTTPNLPPTVTHTEVERELLLEELRLGGVLAEEDWTHGEASTYLSALHEESDEALAFEPPPPPRRVLQHKDGLVVLETPQEAELAIVGTDASAEASGWVWRSLHFEDSVGVVQTEVRCHPERRVFDYDNLSFAVHRAFRALIVALAPHLNLAQGLAVLGGGGGALPMNLLAARDSGGLLSGLGRVAVVEKDLRVADVARSLFGLREGPAGVDLFLMGAEEFIIKRPSGAATNFAAVFVDINGPEDHGRALLSPPPEFLAPAFVHSVAETVSICGGAVAWNVLVSAVNNFDTLRACAQTISAILPSFTILAIGPIPHDDGCIQWLLVAFVDAKVQGDVSRIIENEGFACLPIDQLGD